MTDHYTIHTEYTHFSKPHNLVVKGDDIVTPAKLRTYLAVAVAFHATRIVITNATNHVILAMSRNF